MLSILAWSHQKVSITPDWLMNWRTVSSPSVCLSEHSVLVRNSRVLLHLCESVKRVFLCECASVGGEVKKHGRGVLQKKKKEVLQPEEMPRCKARVCVCVCGSECVRVCVCVCVSVCVGVWGVGCSTVLVSIGASGIKSFCQSWICILSRSQ